MTWKERSLDTQLVHAGDPDPRVARAVAIPIVQSTCFELEGGESYEQIRYPRLNNLPNHTALGKKLAAIEEGEEGLVFASGMAAITTTLLATLGKNGHLLAQRTLYGGTLTFISHYLQQLGAEFDYVDGNDPDSWQAKLKPNTRVFYAEAITNPLLEVADHTAIASFAAAHDLCAVIDNTFATPVNFKPLTRGYDVCVHSATKYLNGHSDLVAGAAIGSRDLIGRIRSLLNELGGSLDPHACFMLNRGLKTLGLRVQRQNENALALAHFLEQHPRVRSVRYPGLASHPDHLRAQQLLKGHGGVLAFELEGGAEQVDLLLRRLTLPINSVSLGGVETLIVSPAATSHAGQTEDERLALGITPTLLRVSVGIETTSDLVGDFEQALSTL